jgi:CheY-like chemotaxis protein
MANGDAFQEYKRAGQIIGIALLIGLAGLFVFALQAGFRGIPAVIGSGVSVLGAGFAVGAVIGFLFGIPRRLQEPAPRSIDPTAIDPSSSVQYAGNTSLEQISDWLTKILVGVGLTQIGNVPSAFATLGEVVGPALGGFEGSRVFGAFEFLYFAIGGFFAAYLWTRLRLSALLVRSEEEARNAARRDTELRALEVTSGMQEVTGAAPPASVPPVGASIPEEGAGERIEPHVLWVDDRPGNNAREIEQLEARGIHVTTKTSSEAALNELRSNPVFYGAVITDLKRGFDRDAGYKLIEAVRDDAIVSSLPFIVYTASSDPELDREAKRHGAIGGTNSPINLLELVTRAVGRNRG